MPARFTPDQRYGGGSRKTARPTPNPISPSTPMTTRGKPTWMPISVRLSRMPSKVTQPLHPRPKFIRLRIANTLLGTPARPAGSDDVGRLASQPNVEQHARPHPVGAPRLRAF